MTNLAKEGTIVKRIITYFILILVSANAFGQTNKKLKPNQYVLSVAGDTINRTDGTGKRTGLWSIYYESRYGDDSYYEVGEFDNNKKQGSWKTYAKNGLLLKEVNYHNDFKHGETKFYEGGRLVCVGQFKALRTDVAYDTIFVEQPITNELKQKIIPTSLGSVRHGLWVYYKPPFNEIKRIEEYQFDDLIYEKDYVTKSDSAVIQSRISKYPHTTGNLPAGFWGGKKGQAPPRYTDFPENMKYVKPNPGKKKDKH